MISAATNGGDAAVGFVFIAICIASWIGSTYVAFRIGRSKNRHLSLLWGFFLGWIGVIIVACQRDLTPVETVPMKTADEIEVTRLETQIKLAELRRRVAAAGGVS